MSQVSQPNYYAVIIAPVRYCKDLEPNAKLLYGEISALCHQEGYCWATNNYFSEIFDVDKRTVSRWLESLKEKGFIHVEIDSTGFQTTRKIWIIKEKFTNGQNCHPPTAKLSPTPEKNVTTSNNTMNNTSFVLRKPYGSHVKLSDQEYANLCSKEDKEKVDEIIQDINDHCVSNRPDGYPDYVVAFRKFVRNQNKTQGKSYGNKNKRKSDEGKTGGPAGCYINGIRIE